MNPPAVVAFDAIETTFSLQALEPRLRDVGLSEDLLPLWFARTLRDIFAMSATQTYAPFAAVAGQTLHALGKESGQTMARAKIDHVMAGFSELEPHADAEAAFRALHKAGVRIITLTNGSATATQTLLQKSGLARYVERAISVDEVEAFKPNPRVYRHAADVMGVPVESLALVATHGWDVHGAKCAGLIGGFVARGQPYPDVFRAPDVVAGSLGGVADGLLHR